MAIGKLYIALAIFISLGLSACGIVQRHHDSGYSNWEYEDPAFSKYASLREEEQSSEFTMRTLNPRERRAVESRLELRLMEKRLATADEKRQYYHYKSLMTNDRERMEFLSLNGIYARKRWLQSKGFYTANRKFDRNLASLVEANDIAVGMPKPAVLESWGRPESISVAGNPAMENESWSFRKEVKTINGYKSETRVVFFENGRVIGWQSH